MHLCATGVHLLLRHPTRVPQPQQRQCAADYSVCRRSTGLEAIFGAGVLQFHTGPGPLLERPPQVCTGICGGRMGKLYAILGAEVPGTPRWSRLRAWCSANMKSYVIVWSLFLINDTLLAHSVHRMQCNNTTSCYPAPILILNAGNSNLDGTGFCNCF